MGNYMSNRKAMVILLTVGLIDQLVRNTVKNKFIYNGPRIAFGGQGLWVLVITLIEMCNFWCW